MSKHLIHTNHKWFSLNYIHITHLRPVYHKRKNGPCLKISSVQKISRSRTLKTFNAFCFLFFSVVCFSWIIKDLKKSSHSIGHSLNMHCELPIQINWNNKSLVFYRRYIACVRAAGFINQKNSNLKQVIKLFEYQRKSFSLNSKINWLDVGKQIQNQITRF